MTWKLCEGSVRRILSLWASCYSASFVTMGTKSIMRNLSYLYGKGGCSLEKRRTGIALGYRRRLGTDSVLKSLLIPTATLVIQQTSLPGAAYISRYDAHSISYRMDRTCRPHANSLNSHRHRHQKRGHDLLNPQPPRLRWLLVFLIIEMVVIQATTVAHVEVMVKAVGMEGEPLVELLSTDLRSWPVHPSTPWQAGKITIFPLD